MPGIPITQVRAFRLAVACGAFAVGATGYFLTGCATHKPCSEGGDTSWSTPMRGDMFCYQKELADHRIVNHGQFVQYFPSGKKFLEGQFKEGEKDGYWDQYNEDGKKVVEKYFDNGVEKAPPAGAGATGGNATSSPR